MTPEQRQEIDVTTDTMARHNLMYRISANNPDKGKPGGDCNVTQCQMPGASSYNGGMHAFYCQECATDIKRFSDDLFEVDILPDGTFQLGDDPLNRELHLPTDKLNPDGTIDSSYKMEKTPRHYGFGTENPFVRNVKKVGRNEPCPCGSNKKYKKCCVGLII